MVSLCLTSFDQEKQIKAQHYTNNRQCNFEPQIWISTLNRRHRAVCMSTMILFLPPNSFQTLNSSTSFFIVFVSRWVFNIVILVVRFCHVKCIGYAVVRTGNFTQLCCNNIKCIIAAQVRVVVKWLACERNNPAPNPTSNLLLPRGVVGRIPTLRSLPY